MKHSPLYLSPPVFNQGIINPEQLGPPEEVIAGFEQEITQQVNRQHGVALYSGTSAIHLAMKLLGIQSGDVVLCQSFTYAATAFPILYEGGTPVFIDSEPDSWNMDPKLLEKALKELTAEDKKPLAHRSLLSAEASAKVDSGGVKAIMLVHLYGMPAKMDELLAIAAKYDVPVIEDAAEALGSTFQGKPCGSFGDTSILSFNSNKIITSSGGGMLLTDDLSHAQKAQYWAAQAKDVGAEMTHQEVGYNYRMSHVNAAIGHSQFSLLNERIKSRRANYEFYKSSLKELPGITFHQEPPSCHSNRWLTTILIDPKKTGGITREDLRLALEADNIEARPLWKPMHLQPVFKDAKAYVNGVSEKLFEQGLCLPSGSNLTAPDLERISRVIRRVFFP